jgi:hypothetical protein
VCGEVFPFDVNYLVHHVIQIGATSTRVRGRMQHVALGRDIRNEYKLLVRRPEAIHRSEESVVNRRLICKSISSKYGRSAWAGLI